MTAIFSSMGLLLLSCVLLSQSMGSEGSGHCQASSDVHRYTNSRYRHRSKCESNFITLRCDPYSVINVTEACWGGKAGQGVCAPRAHSFQKDGDTYFSDVRDRVKTQCQGQCGCRFLVSSSRLGNTPYQVLSKFLEVVYTCEPRVSGNYFKTYVCDDNYVLLDCTSVGQSTVVKIENAIYGRMCKDMCDPQVLGINKNSNDCLNVVSDKLKRQCNGRPSCSFSLTSSINLTLSEACEDVYKYLYVQYRCQ